MNLEQRMQEEVARLKRMGWCLLGLAALTIGTTYFLPTDENNYWVSSEGKQGFYVLSVLFIFLGLYCLGAVWRRRHFF